MPPQVNPVVAAADAAIETAVLLIGACNEQHRFGHAIDPTLFDQLLAHLDALPFDQAQSCYFRNTVADCRTLAATGYPLAARRQMVQIVRKLRAFRDRWLAAVPSVIPHPAASAGVDDNH